MKRFIIKIIKYSIVVLILLEIVVRLFTLTNDVPQRDIDENGLQVFRKNQEGQSHGHKWKINSSGFLGHNKIKGANQVLIVDDSFVENIMNPFECRQSSFFIDNYDFEESIQEINQLNDRVQISLKTSQLSLEKIKAKYLKKILYNYKTLYYLYLKSQKGNITSQSKEVNHSNK